RIPTCGTSPASPSPRRCWCWCRAAAMARRCCSAASATPSARAGTGRAPVPRARSRPTAWTTPTRSTTSTRSCRACSRAGPGSTTTLADTEFDLKLIGWLNRVRAQVRLGAQPPHEFLELGHLLDEMRLFKSRDELKLMRHAARISMQAHEAAMRAARPGVREYELQAELERVFRAAGAEPAYNSIVGAGANTCELHTRAQRGQARDGDLVLIDAAGEDHGYAAVVPRPSPAKRRFTTPQRALPDLVDAARAAALEQAGPGVPCEAGHEAAV